MAQEPKCKKCGDWVHWGPVLCEKCSATLKRDLAVAIVAKEQRDEWLLHERGLSEKINELHQEALAKIAASKEQAAYWYKMAFEATVDLAAAQARIAFLEEDSRVWDKHSFVQLVQERGELRERVAVLTEALTQYQEVIGECTKRMTRTQLREFVSLMDDGNLTLLHLNDKARNAITPAKKTTSLQQGVDAVSPPDRQVFKGDDAEKETA